MCVGRYAEKMQWSLAKWSLFEPLARSNLFGQMPAIDMSVLCIPAECDNIKLPIECEIASRWDAYLLCDICRHFASVMLHFASLIPHNLRCIPAYAHLIPMGLFSVISHVSQADSLYIIVYSFHARFVKTSGKSDKSGCKTSGKSDKMVCKTSGKSDKSGCETLGKPKTSGYNYFSPLKL